MGLLSNLSNDVPRVIFALVSFSLGQIGDGLNIFQGIYLVNLGWNEGSVGLALSLMGFTSLLFQTFAGDLIDRTSIDRRVLLTIAAFTTACTASAILLVREGNQDHALMYITKIIEGLATTFIGPCLASLTLAYFGPKFFDEVMANNIVWNHLGTVATALLTGLLAYILYPDIKYGFLVLAASFLQAVIFIKYIPEGDPLMARGFHGEHENELDKQGHIVTEHREKVKEGNDTDSNSTKSSSTSSLKKCKAPEAASYRDVFSDSRICILCLTGFFFHFANANVLLVLGELMGENNDDGSVKRSAFPLVAGAICTAQVTMTLTTMLGDKLTKLGYGRKFLFLAGLLSLPIRCALILLWRDAGDAYLLSTQVLDGIGGGFFGLLHPFLVADITFGTGRFNVAMGLTGTCFGIGATLSNYLGQLTVEHMGHVASLFASLILSVMPILLFGVFMPETLGLRGKIGDDIVSHPTGATPFVALVEKEVA